MTLSDWLMIIAVLLAPLVAVQVQKFLENFREDRSKKLNLFKTLMATRAATVSPQHVQALNAIDLEFQGNKYKKVTDSWKAYLDHLNHYPKDDEKQQTVWKDRRVDMLSKLLIEMGSSLGYTFDEVHVKRAIYAPEAHAQQENENWLLRRGLLRILYGDSNLKMEVTSLPVGEQIALEQKALRIGMQELIDGKRKLGVSISSTDEHKSKNAQPSNSADPVDRAAD